MSPSSNFYFPLQSCQPLILLSGEILAHFHVEGGPKFCLVVFTDSAGTWKCALMQGEVNQSKDRSLGFFQDR